MIFSENMISYLGTGSAPVQALLADLERKSVVSRLWNKDASLWKSDSDVKLKIVNRLGWLRVAEMMRAAVPDLIRFRREILEAGFKNVVLLGMGGSSLCPEVCKQIFGISSDSPGFHVLDTTNPTSVLRVEKKLRSEKSLFILASKSGSTLEVDSLYRYFYEKVKSAYPEREGEHFIAITDPGTSLEKLARTNKFRRVFTNPSDIGGRYSALSYFGLVPAILIGVDATKFLDRALNMSEKCKSENSPGMNPGLSLGAVLASLGELGRNKVTFVLPPPFLSFGIWAEQLLAESTGKEGRGLVPVEGERIGVADVYGTDRLFVFYRITSEPNGPQERQVEQLIEAGQPVVVLQIEDRYDLAGEFFRWEMATAVSAISWKINPFDEPNVTESKENTGKILEIFKNSGELPASPILAKEGNVSLYGDQLAQGSTSFTEHVLKFLNEIPASHYLVLMAYLDASEENEILLQELRHLVRDHFRLATAIGYGPRFLHSTGQLHKGGPDEGAFIQITTTPPEDIPIPGREYSFDILNRSQALGDLDSLKKRGLPVLRLHLNQSPGSGLRVLIEVLKKSFK